MTTNFCVFTSHLLLYSNNIYFTFRVKAMIHFSTTMSSIPPKSVVQVASIFTMSKNIWKQLCVSLHFATIFAESSSSSFGFSQNIHFESVTNYLSETCISCSEYFLLLLQKWQSCIINKYFSIYPLVFTHKSSNHSVRSTLF